MGRRGKSVNGQNRIAAIEDRYLSLMDNLIKTLEQSPGITSYRAAQCIGIPKQYMGNVLTLMEDTGRLLWEDDDGGLYFFGLRRSS